MTTLACSHQEVDQPRRVCLHLLARRDAGYCKRFTGIGQNYDLLGRDCQQQPECIETHLREVCQSGFDAVEQDGYWVGILGQPQALERSTLFACSAARGTSVWDSAAGERLLSDASLRPLRYHRGARQFLTRLPDGAFPISRLVGRE